MTMQKVEFVQYKETQVMKNHPTLFQLQPTRGWVPLQKIAFWFLKKINATAMIAESVTTRVTFNKERFTDSLIRQHHTVMQMYRPDRPVELFIGPDDFRKLINAPEIRQLIEFTTSVNYGDQHGTRVLGMRVTVVPWMQGVLVVPERK